MKHPLAEPAPTPPYPSQDNALLRSVIATAMSRLRDNLPINVVLCSAVVDAWAQGHIEGEDVCTGCKNARDARRAAAMGKN